MQSFVDGASRNTVIAGANSIRINQIPNNRFVDPSNPLISDDIDRVITEHHNGTRIITFDEYSTFLASSSLIHAFDGWIYLAHAVESLLKGDQGIAIHLAYYAELRGTMSFLSSEGIAVLNHLHLSTNATNNVIKFRNNTGTHSFTWSALEKYLSSTAKSKNDILKVFNYSGKNFFEWLNAVPNSSSIIAEEIVLKWLKKWTFEIHLLKSDRDFRNKFSYRPNKAFDNPPINFENALNKLSSYWSLLEPQNTSSFKLLDQYLLKKFLKDIHSYIQINLGRTINYEDLLKDTFNNLRLTLTPAEKSFFISPNDHHLFTEANNTIVDPINGINPISTIARATLLLRLCIGYSSNDLKSAGISASDITFFTNNLGQNNGFWNTIVPTNFEDLWDDIGSAIEDINVWCNGRTLGIKLEELNLELSNELVFYKQINRASFWGLNLI